jgi:hypothetical protein
MLLGNGGPGRGRSHNADGTVKTNHQAPMMKRTRRKLSVEECIERRMKMQTSCTKSEAE